MILYRSGPQRSPVFTISTPGDILLLTFLPQAKSLQKLSLHAGRWTGTLGSRVDEGFKSPII